MTGDMIVPNRIFVGGLPANANLDELQKYFCKIGEDIGARVVDIKIKMDVRGCSEGYGFVTFEEEKHVKKILNLDKDKFKFQDKALNIQQAFYTARRRPFPFSGRERHRGFSSKTDNDGNDPDDYFHMSPRSMLASPNMQKSSENEGSELSKIYVHQDDNNNNVFVDAEEKDVEPSSSSAPSSAKPQSEGATGQSCTSTNSLPSSEDAAGKPEVAAEDQRGAGRANARSGPRQSFDGGRSQSRNGAPGGGRGYSQGGTGRKNSNDNRQGRNFSNLKNEHNHRSNSMNKGRQSNGGGGGQNSNYRSNSISTSNKNYFRNLTVDTRGSSPYKKLFSPLTYLASKNAASLNQSQASPYGGNNPNNMSNQALGYYYAMAAAAAGSPHGAMMTPNGSRGPNARSFQPSGKPGRNMDHGQQSTTCYAGSVLNNCNDNMYTAIVNSANSNVGSEQASISHFLHQADMPVGDYQNYNQNQYYQAHLATSGNHQGQQQAPAHPKYHNAASVSAAAKYVNHSASLNSCAAVTSPSGSSSFMTSKSGSQNTNQLNSKESNYDMSQQQQAAQSSNLSSTSKSSLANELIGSTTTTSYHTQCFSPYSQQSTSNASDAGHDAAKDSAKIENGGQYSHDVGPASQNAPVADQLGELMAKNLNLGGGNEAPQYEAHYSAFSGDSRPYFVRPPVQYSAAYQGPSSTMIGSPRPPQAAPFQPNVPPPPIQPQYVYCYNAAPSHMIQQQSRMIVSPSQVPIQPQNPQQQQQQAPPINVPQHLSGPISVVFASNQHMAYSMAMSPQQHQQQYMANYNSQMSHSNYQLGQPLAVQLTSPNGPTVAYLSPNPNFPPVYQQSYPAPVYANSSSMPYYGQAPPPPSAAMSQMPSQQLSSYPDNQNVQQTDPYRYQDQSTYDTAAMSAYNYSDASHERAYNPMPSSSTSAELSHSSAASCKSTSQRDSSAIGCNGKTS